MGLTGKFCSKEDSNESFAFCMSANSWCSAAFSLEMLIEVGLVLAFFLVV